MASSPITEVGGLQLSNGTFGSSPPGSLQRADNCVEPQKGVIEPRRGQEHAYVPPSAGEIPWAQCEFRGSLIINSASARFDDYTLGVAANPTVDFTDGPWNPVDSTPDFAAPQMKFGFAGSYLHFCTTTGPKALETLTGPPRTSGLRRMPDIRAAVQSASAASVADNNWLPYGAAVAYRSVLRLPTDDGTSLLSPPSGRAVVANSIVAAVGAMVRSGTTVTVTFAGTTNPGLLTGDTFTLSPGEANFAAGTYTVTSDADNVITYTNAGAAVANTAIQSFNTGRRSVAMQIYLSADATEATPVCLYRSHYTSSATVEPSDEMFLVAELTPSAMNISQGYITYEDFTPDSVINDPLYTNPQTGEGPSQANYSPPLYRDTTNWGERQWYAQTTGPQTFNLQMLGVGMPDGIQDGDTLTLDVPDATATPYVFTFKNTPSTSDEVQIVSNGLASFNIQQTAQNLALAINAFMAFNGTPLRAYYDSAQNEAPGKVLLQRTTIIQDNFLDDGAFSLIASRPASWVPALDTSTPVWSDDEYQPNGLAYAKLGQPEAVPLVNYTAVGSKNYPIARIIGLQNALLVFKRGDGIYSVSGTFPFQVLQISTANIIAPDACGVLADNAWCYTDQGFIRISDSGGSSVVSRPIETELNRLRAELPEMTSTYSFVVPYETERRIMLFVPFSGDDDTAPPTLVLKAWCYNNATQAWTGPLTYGLPFSGVVGLVSNRLSLGMYDSQFSTGRVTLERKGDDYFDYADASYSNSITATSVGGNPLVIRLSTSARRGDGIVQGQWATKIRRTRPDLGSRYYELYEEIPWSVAACTTYKHYDVVFQFLPQSEPLGRRTLTRLQHLFKPEWFAALTSKTLVFTDQVQADLEIDTPSPGFGLTPFGTGPFGNPTPLMVDVNPVSASWATAAQFFVGLSTSEVWMKVRAQGMGLTVDSASGPAGRGRG